MEKCKGGNLKKIINDTSDFIYIKNKQRHLVIYGNGEVAREFWNLHFNEIEEFKSVQIVVTNPLIGMKFQNKEVFSYKKIKDYEPSECAVIVATHEYAHEEIYTILKDIFDGDIFFVSELYFQLMKTQHIKKNLDRKQIALYYADLPNMGDQLNKLVIPECFGLSVEWENLHYSNMTGIGSYLDNLFLPKEEMDSPIYKAEYALNVWGTGFNRDEDISSCKLLRDDIKFFCLRGNLSKEKLENYYGSNITCALGDPALLVRDFIDSNVDKRYSIGIISHYREQGMKILRDLYEKYENSIVINLRNDPRLVIKQIVECETILTSSLHGAIIADAMGIPNILVKISNIPHTDGFKYADYYSVYDLPLKRVDLKLDYLPSVEKIKNEYIVLEKDVKCITSAIKASFPYRSEIIQ